MRRTAPDYVAVRERWKEELAWDDSRTVQIGISTSWPIPWEWDDGGRCLRPLRREHVHLVRAVLGMTREDGLREREDALCELESTDLEPWLATVDDPRGCPDMLFSVTIHMGMDGMGYSTQAWRALAFDESHALIVTDSCEHSPLAMPLGLASLDDPLLGVALLARDHPVTGVGGCVGFESLDMFEVEGLDVREAYRMVLGICGVVDEVLLAEDPAAEAARGGHRLPGGLSLFASRLPGPDGRRRISRVRGGPPRREELGALPKLVGRWTVGYPGDDGLIEEATDAGLELGSDGTYRWDSPPSWAREEGRWGVVRRGEGIQGIFVESPKGEVIEHYLVLKQLDEESPPVMHWQLTRWDGVVVADRVLTAHRPDGPRVVS